MRAWFLQYRLFFLLGFGIELAYVIPALIAAGPTTDAFLIGDCPYYAAASESLLFDQDWDLTNNLLPGIRDPQAIRQLLGDHHNTQFAMSADDRVVLKHSPVLSFVSMPFRLLFGRHGFLLFNLVQLLLLVQAIAALGGGGRAAQLVALLALATTPLLRYSFNFSPDVLCALLVCQAWLAAGRRSWLLAGLLSALAIWAKVYAGFLVLPAWGLTLLPVPNGKTPRSAESHAIPRLFIGLVAGLLPMVLIQLHLFGNPFLTGYDRAATVTDAGIQLADHYSRFNQPMVTGFFRLLFDDRLGMLATAPLWFLWPVAAFLILRDRRGSAAERWSVAGMILAIFGNLLVFAAYDEWNATAFGNRFLFPALALGFGIVGRAAAVRYETQHRKPA